MTWKKNYILCINIINLCPKRFLTGTDSGLRVGLASSHRRNLLKGPWEKFTKVYKTLRSDDTVKFIKYYLYIYQLFKFN